ncbi:outer envelope pore protein 16-2, chloroplastic isoform X2 [Cryptomeria japonica]|uniref:outer envelope pore protein 16-2, chloroplastic isoform X2 n=1 Tax=Cryptomeria japonica TaxID=3369 RepID=UPI0027DA042B|nr:outer envelope pore protein 16-2, chloroplastic isoform X2 [Cryptomeria japonica]
MNMNDMDGRSIIEEIKRFNGESFFDLGHPLLNGVAESFVKAAGIGAVQAVSREAYYTTIEGFNDEESGVEFGNKKRGRLPRRGESHGKSLEALVIFSFLHLCIFIFNSQLICIYCYTISHLVKKNGTEFIIGMGAGNAVKNVVLNSYFIY